LKGLVRVVTAQQLSVASAEAIWRRLEAAVEPFTPSRFLSVSESDLRAAGLSKVKIATLRGLAEAIDTGSLDLDALSQEPEDVIHAKLTALKGIGPWTADIYILFCLARADAWSPGDLALQVAVKDAFELEAWPNQDVMMELAEAWRPWRAVAARMLWAYYSARRKTSALPV
jgi:DNA-3-methyladenine glycosylase II